MIKPDLDNSSRDVNSSCDVRENNNVEYICVLDFEATCESYRGYDHEIIEFPSVLLRFDPKVGQYIEISRFDEFCRPRVNPTVSKFCFELTGITQEQVNHGRPFPEVLQMHIQWLRKHIEYTETEGIKHFDPEYPEGKVIILTCGSWDLGTVMLSECKKWERMIPPRIYRRFIDVKKHFTDFYKTRSMGMAGMLKYAKIPLVGRHHSGIDDSVNIASIVQKMVSDGYEFNDVCCIEVSSKCYL